MNKIIYTRLNETLFYTVLENGLKVYMIPKNDFEKTYCVFKTNFGSKHTKFINETTKKEFSFPHGIAHFLEHQMFSMENMQDAGDYFASFGADSNAYTSYDETAYTVTCTKNQQNIIEFLLNFVQKPYFTTKGIAKEKNVIIQEYKMYQDKPSNRLHYGLMNNLYWNHYLKDEIVGNENSIKQINMRILKKAYRLFYHPSNMILVLAGNLNVEETLNWIVENQSKKQFIEPNKIMVVKQQEPILVQKTFEEFYMDISSPYAAYGIKINPFLEKPIDIVKLDYMIKMILEQLFGSSSDTYQELLDNELISKRFRYQAHVSDDSMYISIQSDTMHPLTFLEFIEKKIQNIQISDLHENSFLRIKKGISGSFIKNTDDVETIVHGLLDALSINSDYFTSLDVLESITMEDIYSVLDLIKKSPFSKLIIHPKKVSKN